MIYVGSLEYSPVYKSHCCAFGKECERSGYQIKYLFSHMYEWMLPQDIKEKTIFIGKSKSISSMLIDSLNKNHRKLLKESFAKDKPTHVYLHNYHILNHYIANLCKKNGGKFIYHSHEPYVENKSAHGGFQRYWLHLSEYMEAKLVNNTDIAVVSSNEGSRLFDKAYPEFKGKKLLIPLIYEDAYVEETRSREFITFVGPPVPAKGTDIFLKIVSYAAEHNLSLPFLLISRNKVASNFLNKPNLTIYYKKNITDEEYGSLMRRSLAVLTPYKRETQSSVILVAYMHGTPVVSSRAGGLPEFVKNAQTGYLIDEVDSIKKWIDRINDTIIRFQIMSVDCRRFFTSTFSQKNWEQYLTQMLA